MRLRKIFYVVNGLGLLLIAALALTISSPHKAAAANSCTVPTTTPASTSTASDSFSTSNSPSNPINIPLTGSYNIWVRMEAGSSSNTSVLLNIDNGTCFTATESSTTWAWTEVATDTPLTTGNHNLVLSAGNNSGVSVDRVEFLSDNSCTPTGTGYNCADNTVNPPYVSITSPASATQVSGTVPIAVTAYSDPYSPATTLSRVDIYVNGSSTPSQSYTSFTSSGPTSQNGTVITPSSGGQIIDSGYNIWTLNGGVIYRNGTETCSSDVIELAYVGGNVYQENSYLGWWEWNNSETQNASDICSGSPWDNQLSAGPTIPTVSGNSITYNLNTSSLTNGNNTVKAVATDSQGLTSSSSVTLNVQNGSTACSSVPSAPGTATKTSSTPNSLTIGWPVSTFGTNCSLSTYSVYEVTSGGNTLLGTSSTNSLVVNSLAPNTTYKIIVTASDSDGVSAASSQASLTTSVDPPPTEPASLTASAPTDALVNLSWAASTDDSGSVTSYDIYRMTGTSGTPPITTPDYATVSGSVLTYQDTSVTPGVDYIYGVVAVGEGGSSAERASSEVAVPSAPTAPTPNAPSGLSATLETSTTISLSWTASSSSDVAGYYVYRCTWNSSSTCVSAPTKVGSTVGINSTSYTDGTSSALTAGTTYAYYVVAYVTSTNVSANSSTIHATTTASTCICSLSADVACKGVVGLSDLSILLSHWGTVSGALHSQGDVNNDGKVNLTDLSIMLSAWGQTDTACI